MDVVALSSVIVTGVLGAGGLLSGIWQTSTAREHEQDMVRENDAAKRREAAEATHLSLARWTYVLARSLENPSPLFTRRLLKRDEDLSARILLYAAPHVRMALAELDELVDGDLGAAVDQLDFLDREKLAAIDEGDFQRAKAMREREIEYRDEIGPVLARARSSVAALQAALRPPSGEPQE